MIAWFAMPCDLADAPHLAHFAVRAGVSVDAAFRHFGKVWARMAQHDDERGQLREIPDGTLEEWAGWRGRQGRFAEAFRESYELADGTMRFWEDTNGPQIRKAKKDAQRKRDARRHRGHRGQPADVDQVPLALSDLPASGGPSTDAGADSPRPRARTGAGNKNKDSNSTTSSAIAAAVVPARGGNARDELPDAYRAAYDGIRSTLSVPYSLDAECQMLASGAHGPGGTPVPWAVIGHAIHDCAGTTGPYSHRKLHAFVTDLLRRADATDVLERELGRRFTPGERTAVDALRAFAAQAGAA